MLGIKDLNIEDINALADVIKEKNLDCISISNEDISVTIKAKREAKLVSSMPAGISVTAQSAPVVQSLTQEKKELSGNIVKSPIVGTYYASPAPDKAPFVKIGQKVNKGDVIMIIESMKLMNEVQSEFDGVVEEILVKNGQAVEFDQPIIVIK